MRSRIEGEDRPGEPKEVEGSALFQIYQAFATAEETAALRQAYADGIGWGDAKTLLFECIDRELAPLRERYNYLMAHPQEVEAILRQGAEKARTYSGPLLHKLRAAVGLRPLTVASHADTPKAATRQAGAAFKQYREKDGKFYFKLVRADGAVLLQSLGFDAPRDAGAMIAQLQAQPQSLPEAMDNLQLGDSCSLSDVQLALKEIAES